MSSSSTKSSSRTSRNQKEEERTQKVLFDPKVNPYEKINDKPRVPDKKTDWLRLHGRTAYDGQKVPPNYTCNRCNQKGHFIYDCPQGKANEGNNVKRSTGIPRSFLQPATVDTPGAKINPAGKLLFFQLTLTLSNHTR